MTHAIQQNIKRALQAKNMTAAELERRTGIPHAVVNILHGRSKNPSLRTAQAIAKELGCSVEELMAEPKQPNPDNVDWNMDLYKQVFKVLCEQVQILNKQPTPEKMSQWLTDIYNYTLGHETLVVDARFVRWLLER